MITRLKDLVPSIYLSRDLDAQGRESGPLIALLEALDVGLGELELAIRQLDDDHFVERASPEALLLLADLYGALFVTDDARVHRAVLARTIHWRRRKGTLRTLEEMLRLTSSWDTEVDESFRSILATQDLRSLVPWRGRTTVIWDPIALADPLTRRSIGVVPPRERGQIADRSPSRLPGEDLQDTLRRLGRADAGRYAASPRTLDLLGWARPDVVVVRTAQLVPLILPRVTPAAVHDLGEGRRGFHVDPLGRDGPLVWVRPSEPPELISSLTQRHEPEPAAPAGTLTTDTMLLPTALAEDGDLAEGADVSLDPSSRGARVRSGGAGPASLEVRIDGIRLVGSEASLPPQGPLLAAPLPPDPVLRISDAGRTGPGDEWRLTLLAAGLPLVIARAPAVVPPIATADAAHPPPQPLSLRVERLRGRAQVRRADGTWSTFDPGPPGGWPRSALVEVEIAGQRILVRLEQGVPQGNLRLARLTPGAPPIWDGVDLGALTLADRTGIAVAAVGESIAVVGLDQDGALGAWRIDDLLGAPQVARLDAPGGRIPRARLDAAVAVRNDRVWVVGGADGDAPLSDTWSVPLAGGPWRAHGFRRAAGRVGATLLSSAEGLTLLGGADRAGHLVTEVERVVPELAGAAWRALAPLPVDPERPGSLAARLDGGGLEAVVWADRIRPALLRLPAGARGWQAGLQEEGSRPPAGGEAAFLNDELYVVGPPPLPPSEVMVVLGDAGHLVFLPSLDLAEGEAFTFDLQANGSTVLPEALQVAMEDRRRPALPIVAQGLFGRRAGAARIGAPGRISHTPYVLRQRSLGPWLALAPDGPDARDTDVVGLDPRLGRVLLGGGVPDGRISVTARTGRGAALGAGLAPRDRMPPPAWREPDLEVQIPPHVVPPGELAARLLTTALVDPIRAHFDAPNVTASLRDAADVSFPGNGPFRASIELRGAPRLAPSRLSLPAASELVVHAAQGGLPIFEADTDHTSLALFPEHGGAPGFAVWLDGLWMAGRLQLVATRGQADLRWCTIGAPGERGVWIPGGGHQGALARSTIPEATVELRLFGCTISVLDVPPWVSVVAAGCTFDAAERTEVAIRAAGAPVRLRHCTVNGATEAGRLEASSCAFAGEVRVDRNDLGFLRHSILPRRGRPPLLYRSLVHFVSFEDLAPTSPGYLVLANNNGEAALTVGEGRRVPGAHGERSDHLRELAARTDSHLPIGMTPFFINRSSQELDRMGRR